MKPMTKQFISRTSVLLVISLLLLTLVASANSPAQELEASAAAAPLISYQGTLTNEQGNPINATVTMQFALYDASSGGTLKWGPETQSVQVTDGLFNVLLGSVTAINPANLTGDLWLNIIVNGEQLTPREKITSVVYTVEALTLLDGATTRGDLTVGDTLSVNGRINLYEHVGINSAAVDDVALLVNGSASIWGGTGVHGDLAVDGGGTFSGNLDMNGHSISRVGPTLTSQMVIGSNFAPGYAGVEVTGTDPRIYITGNAGSGWKLNDFRVETASFVIDKGDLWVSGGGSLGAALNMNGHSVINCGALTEANLQTEEEQAAGGSDRFDEGDVLCWSANAQRLEKCATPSDPLVQAVADAGGRPIVMGAEVVKVIGPVRVGEYLVASALPGYAMASPNPTFGIVIAQALEDLEGDKGLIKAMIRKM